MTVRGAARLVRVWRAATGADAAPAAGVASAGAVEPEATPGDGFSGGTRTSDDEFVAHLYRKALGREVDAGASAHYASLIADGWSRLEVTLLICSSDEFLNEQLRRRYVLPSLRDERPDRFEERVGVPTTFRVEADADFDWLEERILANGYYERPGSWSLSIDRDKEILAEAMLALEPRRSLEIGCSSGVVIGSLRDRGVDAEGVEISSMAIGRASVDVRTAVHRGDLLDLGLAEGSYDLVAGFDIFEHFNPNRLDAYLAEVARVLRAGGKVLANIPVYAPDSVFGTGHPHLDPTWTDDLAAGGLLRRLPVDGDGYPRHGHLVWAGSAWWVERFAAVGLVSQPESEAMLHDRYDAEWDEISAARKMMFVFVKPA